VPTPNEEPNRMSQAVRAEFSLLTAQDVADLLKVKIGWIYDQVEAETFPVIRLGRQLRFRVSDIQAYLDARYHGVTPYGHLHPVRPVSSRRGRPRRQ